MYTKCLADMSYTVLPQQLLYPAFHFVPNPSSINFDRFPKALMFQFGYTCSGLEGWVKKNNCCQYGQCPYHSPARWEPGPNRVLRLLTHSIDVEATMVWGDDDVRTLATGRLAAKKDKVTGRDGYVSKQELVSIKFHVECNVLKPGERVFVVGSLPELGDWDPAGAIACYTSDEAFPLWSSAQHFLALQGCQAGIEFKVLVQGEKSAEKEVGGTLALPQLWASVKMQWAAHLAALKKAASEL